jgi:hypothetical protein
MSRSVRDAPRPARESTPVEKPVESCPNHWMDGPNEVRCWSGVAGHDGPCR